MMNFKYIIRKLFNLLGYEILKFNPLSSESAQLLLMLKRHRINLVIDIGANTGQYASMLFTSGFDGKIVSFEPIPAAHTKLVKLSHNNPNWVIAERCALGNKNQFAIFHVSRNSLSSSMLPMLKSHLDAAPESKYVNNIKVKVVKLDDVINKYITRGSRIYLKIDAQGYEDKILKGAKNLLTRAIGIQLELSLTPLYQGQLLYKETVSMIERIGYDLYNIFPGFVNTKNGKLLQIDGIFFKKKQL